MFSDLLHGSRRKLATFLRLSAFIASATFAGAAFALPSCPTLIYEGPSPATGGLIDPGHPTVTFKFSRKLVPISITGGVVPLYPPRYPWQRPTTKSYPRIAMLFDDYGLQVPIDVKVDGGVVSIRPLAPLKPNKYYRYLLQGIAGPILAEHPDSVSAAFCPQPSIKYNIVAEYYTRPTATGGCLPGPTAVTNNRYGLTPGCRYNLSYESYQVSNEDDDITDAVWAWHNARWTVRGYTSYPTSEQRGVKVQMTNVSWNGSYWVAQSATATVTGAANTPQSLPEGAVIATYNNVIVASNNHMLLLENYLQGWNGYQQSLVPYGDVRGFLTLSPAP